MFIGIEPFFLKRYNYINYSWESHFNWIFPGSIWQSWMVWGFAGSVWESCSCYHGPQHHLSSSSVWRLSYLQRPSDRRPSLARPDLWTHSSCHMGVVHRPGETELEYYRCIMTLQFKLQIGLFKLKNCFTSSNCFYLLFEGDSAKVSVCQKLVPCQRWFGTRWLPQGLPYVLRCYARNDQQSSLPKYAQSFLYFSYRFMVWILKSYEHLLNHWQGVYVLLMNYSHHSFGWMWNLCFRGIMWWCLCIF